MRTKKLIPTHSFIAAVLVVLTVLSLTTSSAVTYYWDNDGATAGFGTAAGTWAAPTIGDGTQGWSTDATGGTLPGNVTTTTNDVLLFGVNTLSLAAGTLNVSGTVEANRINFAGASTGIVISNGTAIRLGGESPSIITTNGGNIIYTPITLAPSNNTNSISFSRNASIASTLALNGVISGSGGLIFTTPNVNSANFLQTVVLGSANDYSGDTTITAGNTGNTTTIKAGADNALPTNTVLTLDGGNGPVSVARTVSYDLNGKSQTLAGLDNNKTRNANRLQRIHSTAATTGTLIINNTNNYTFSGNLGVIAANWNFGLIKNGSGTFTLTAANAYTNTTLINAGKLQFQVGGNCANSTVVLNATTATNVVSITDNTKLWTCAALAPAAAGVMEFNFGAVTPSTSISPLSITGVADFTAATPKVRVVTTGLATGTYPLMTWGSKLGAAPTTADLTVDVLAPLTTADLNVVGNVLNLEITSIGGTVVKANNTNNLNLGTSWVGGVAPNSTKVAKWDSTVTSANTTLLGANVTWAGIEIADPNGLVTIDPGNTLTLGGASTNIDMAAATADLTLKCSLALGSDSVWDVQTGRTLTVTNTVSGAGTNDLTTQNAGTVILSSEANSYSGNTTVAAASTLKLGAANVIPNGDDKGSVTVEGTLDLNTFSETLNGLSGAGTVDTVAGGTPTLTLGSTNDSATFTGIIQDTAGTLSLTKTNTGRQDLTGVNTLSGAVLVNQGWLAVGQTNAPFANVSSITVANGATFGAYESEVDIDVPITLGAGSPTINIAAGVAPLAGSANTIQRPFRLNAGITGTGNVVFIGMNPFNWTGAINVSNCNYTGSTLITTAEIIPGFVNTNNANIVVRLLGNDALPTTTVVTLDGYDGVGSGRFCDLNLAGKNQTLAGLTNITRLLRSQRVVNPGTALAATLTINNGADYEFSGFMGATSGGSSPGNNLGLVKSGSGTFTLAKANGNTYTNGTIVNGGTLLVNNTTGSGTGTGDVNINSGGTLGGMGIISGIVTNNSGGTLAPGASIGTLTLNGNVVLNAGSTNTFEVDGTTSTNDVVVLGSTVTYGGVLKIVPTGTFTNGQTFTLFSGVGATDLSNFGSIVGSPGVGQAFAFTNGVLTVVSTGPAAPTPEPITRTVSGGNLILSWTQPSWTLLTGTNVTAITNIIPGAASPYTNSLNEPKRFYRLTYP